MNQQKIGSFFKELRNERNLTQEQLAEVFGVSRRTVSRWETGSNMPDLALLVEMADFTNEQKRKLLRMMQWLFIAGCVSFILHIIVDSYRPDVSDFLYGLLKGATLGSPVAIVSC